MKNQFEILMKNSEKIGNKILTLSNSRVTRQCYSSLQNFISHSPSSKRRENRSKKNNARDSVYEKLQKFDV